MPDDKVPYKVKLALSNFMIDKNINQILNTANLRDPKATHQQQDKETLKGFLEFVESENSYVKDEHAKAKKSHTTAEDVLDDEILKEVVA